MGLLIEKNRCVRIGDADNFCMGAVVPAKYVNSARSYLRHGGTTGKN
jgi:hypothetical protein